MESNQESQTYGDYVDLEENPSFFEVGGWADGQSLKQLVRRRNI